MAGLRHCNRTRIRFCLYYFILFSLSRLPLENYVFGWVIKEFRIRAASLTPDNKNSIRFYPPEARVADDEGTYADDKWIHNIVFRINLNKKWTSSTPGIPRSRSSDKSFKKKKKTGKRKWNEGSEYTYPEIKIKILKIMKL